MNLRIHHFLPFTYANGPGCRATLWVQGCPLHCLGCSNPGTHAFGQGEWLAVDELAERIKILGRRIEGVTVSGGEPFNQVAALSELLHRLRSETMLTVIVFTGYWEDARGILRGF